MHKELQIIEMHGTRVKNQETLFPKRSVLFGYDQTDKL